MNGGVLDGIGFVAAIAIGALAEIVRGDDGVAVSREALDVEQRLDRIGIVAQLVVLGLEPREIRRNLVEGQDRAMLPGDDGQRAQAADREREKSADFDLLSRFRQAHERGDAPQLHIVSRGMPVG